MTEETKQKISEAKKGFKHTEESKLKMSKSRLKYIKENPEEAQKQSNNRLVHGMSETRTWTSWKEAKKRCYMKKHHKYKQYGGSGIKMCDEWIKPNGQGFVNFLKDMGERPDGTTIDRYPNKSGNYEPNNCRWATPKEQANNRRYKNKK